MRPPATTEDAPAGFASLAALKAAHIELLERRRLGGDDPAFLAEIAAFVRRGSATGALLSADDDRWTSQSMLDYWSNLLYRLGREPPDATLASFDPALAPELADALCPYLGLDAFGEAQHDRFFGRERLVAELVERLAARRFLAVVGPSGSGKSSLVLGGLLPALKAGALPGSREWRYCRPIVPGADPLGNLARLAAPAGPARRQSDRDCPAPSDLADRLSGAGAPPAVVVVDQFEEIFTLCDDDRARQAFIDSLLALAQSAGPRHTVVLTMRSDFESYVARLPRLQPRLAQSQLRVVSLSAAELREAIEQPAERVGLKFEDGIVDALVQEILGEPAGLPLLQFTLLKLWESRERNRVTWEAYGRLGGARLALARSADAWYEALIPEEQVTAKRLLLRMVRPGEGLEVTSGRVRRAALHRAGEAPERIDRVLEKLAQARLARLTPGDIPADDQAEVAHEALVRNWPKLVAWLEDERVAMRRRLHLAAAAQQWEALGRDPGAVLRGPLLDEARRYDDLAEGEAAFVQASQAAAERAEQEEQAARQRELAQIAALDEARRRQAIERRRAEEQARANRRTRLFAAALVVLLALALGAGAIAFMQGGRARRAADAAATAESGAKTQAAIASRTAAEAQALALSSGAQVALGQGNTDLALALSLAANLMDEPVLQAQLTLSEAAYAPGTRRLFKGHGAAVRAAAFSPDGRTALSASEDTTVILWDVATGRPIRRFEGHAAEVHGVAFSPDGRAALSASEDTTVILWDVATGRPIRRFEGHAESVNAVAFSPDGRSALSGAGNTTSPTRSTDNTLILWDVATGRPIRRLAGHAQTIWAAAFSPDGRLALSGAADASLILWDLASGSQLRGFAGHSGDVFSVAFSADGRAAVSGSRDARLGVWDVATGEHFFLRHGSSVRAAAFSPDGRQLLSGSLDTTLRLWDRASGAELRRLEGHTGAATAVAFSPDGRSALSASADKRLILWDVATGARVRELDGHAAGVFGAAFSPDGRMALSASEDKTLILWDVATGQAIRRLVGHADGVSGVAFAPDGRTALSSSVDRTLILWDVATGRIVRRLEGHRDKVLGVAIGPDGRTALSASEDKTVILWDLATGAALRRLEGHGATVRAVAFSPDGQTALSGSDDQSLVLWDLNAGQIVRRLVGHGAAVRKVALGPRGATALSASADTDLILWDVATGQAIRRLVGHAAAVRDVAFSPDGATALSASVDTTVRQWRIDSRDELIDWAGANRYVPELTCDQRELYRLEPRCDQPSPAPTSPADTPAGLPP